MNKPGMFQEQDGSFSMRRVLAAMFAVTTISLLTVAAVKGGDNLVSLYAGIASGVMTLLLLFFTTWESIAQVVGLIKTGRSVESTTIFNAPAVVNDGDR